MIKMNNDINFKNGNYAKKKSYFLRRLIKLSLIVFSLAALIFLVFFIFSKISSNTISIRDIKKAWEQYDYEKVYDLSSKYLQKDSYNNSALTYYGYACFFLSQSQTDTQTAQQYLDESINKMRIALYSANSKLKPQLEYMLGRAYFFKNTITSYYYADLAVKYINLAKEDGFISPDIPKLLGLSYASLGMTMESIAAFSEALLEDESDFLLLSIAEQYYNAKELNISEQYLFRIVQNSDNEDIILKSRILLGNIYIEKESYEEALEEFNKALELNPESADAHYAIGLIYEKQGNIVKARAEWRTALKLMPSHQLSRAKLSES